MMKKLFNTIGLFSLREKKKVEFDSGFIEERRSLLWLPAVAATALLLPKQVRSDVEPISFPGEGLGWNTFIKETLPIAKELHKISSVKGQDAYVFWLASMAARLNFRSIPETRLRSFANLNPPIETGLAYRGVPFFIIEWRMSPNASLPPHNHPNISVCTVCIEGMARIRNFEPVGKTPDYSSAKEFTVKQTHNEILTPGRINTLSSRRDNIHTFQAGNEGARGIDITTYHGKDQGFSFLDIESKPIDTGKGFYQAIWKKL